MAAARNFSWEPGQYLRHADARRRPAVDLLARIGAENPALVCDLGCGPGNVTALLRARWPDARLAGVDDSNEMLATARAEQRGIGAEWINQDIATWAPPAPPDVIFSNAALHWLDDHASLMPRLLETLAPEGWFAVQMPDNFAAPSHRIIYRVARRPDWRDRLAPLIREQPVHATDAYYAMLRPCATKIDIWRTTYLHVLEGDRAVLDWVRGSILRTFLARLEPAEASVFEELCADELAEAYPRAENGETTFPFSRLFIVARRRG